MSILTGGRLIEESGLGSPLLNAGAPVDGVSGTYAGIAAVGARLVDTTNKNLYLNGGTQLSPTWKLVTRAA